MHGFTSRLVPVAFVFRKRRCKVPSLRLRLLLLGQVVDTLIYLLEHVTLMPKYCAQFRVIEMLPILNCTAPRLTSRF